VLGLIGGFSEEFEVSFCEGILVSWSEKQNVCGVVSRVG
jgi:hypothetical protein